MLHSQSTGLDRWRARPLVRLMRPRPRLVCASGAPGGTEALAPVRGVLEAALQDGETILLRRRPSLLQPGAQILVGVVLLAMLGLIVVAFGARPSANPWMWVLAGVIAAGAFIVPWPMLDWWGTRYVLTDRRVLTVRGVLSRTAVELPLSAVRSVESLPNALGKIADVGTILIGNPVGEPPVVWVLIPKPEEARRAVIEAVRRYGRGSFPGGVGGSGA